MADTAGGKWGSYGPLPKRAPLPPGKRLEDLSSDDSEAEPPPPPLRAYSSIEVIDSGDEGVDFAGASGAAANAYVPLHYCELCSKEYAHFGGMCYLKQLPGLPFEDAQETNFRRALDGTHEKQSVVNSFRSYEVMYTCIHCAEQKHKKSYHDKGGK